MKRVFVLGMIGIAVLASCKKNRNCQCVYTDGDVEEYIVVNETKKSAKNICGAKSSSSRSCELK